MRTTEQPDPKACSIYRRGVKVETAPGIFVGKNDGACGREAANIAHWTDTVLTNDPERPERKVEMHTPICAVHVARITRGTELLLDGVGMPVDVEFTDLDEQPAVDVAPKGVQARYAGKHRAEDRP